ncbi:MAG TPA: type VI secretion system membrane subunit TssM [Stellaceae bacterium]
MSAVPAFFASRWVPTLVGTALLAVLLWFFGPFLSPLEGWGVRLAIIVAMFVVWAGANLVLDLRRRGRDAALAKGVAAQPDAAAVASAEEAAALQDKLGAALALLRKARGSKTYLYEQPWYAIIGPPGAGKTTALLNAGLRFPLAAEMGQGAVAGVGGTRLCDWWFTEDAVLIDTAGRYTTQDSDAAVDRAGWQAFLDLLKRTRLRQPLNGIIVAIALTELGGAGEERRAHARAIRQRVKEIGERLGIRLPIYVLFTKADLIAGFTEFFDDLDREKRAQVWGATFPLISSEAGPVPGFVAEFRALIERLNSRLLDRLQTERSPDRRGLIAGFGAQLASFEAPLDEFLQDAFRGSRLDPAPMLRGFYFTSGTQEGTPIDRLTGVLSRSFGIDQRRAASLRPERGRSYFLGRLVKDVIFGEAMLGSEKPGAASRRVLLRSGAFAAAALAVLAGAALLWHDRSVNQRQIAQMSAALAAYDKTASGLPLDPVADADLPRILPLLAQARASPHGYDAGRSTSAAWPQLGLSQDAKLAAGALEVYRHALGRVLLPRLIWRLETQMHGSLDRPDFLYEATRIYLMLGSAGPLDRGLVRTWMSLDWQAAYPGPGLAPMRDRLAGHLNALLADPLPPVALDGPLVAAARATFSRVPLAERVYSRIAASASPQAVASWRPADALGVGGARLFVRASGKSLSDGIPGFYTIDGFYKVLLPALGDITKEVANESWVLGSRAEIAPDSSGTQDLENQVIGLYEADYAKEWDAMLADLDIVPLRSPEQAAQDLYVLGSPQSPIRDLLASIARQLTLSQPPPSPPVVIAATTIGDTGAARAAPATVARLKTLLGTQSAGPLPPPAGQAIDERYRALREFVGKGPGAPIDQALQAINALQQQLAKMAAAAPGGAPAAPAAPTGDDPVLLLRAEASRDPPPAARWLEAMAASGNALRSGGAREQAAAAFNGAGGPANLCQKAVAGRYPFVPGAENEIPLDDFARLFAPGGLLDGFFNTELRPYVDTAERTWRAQPVDGVPAPIAPAQLARFQRAAVIRDLFFAVGGTTPMVRFDIIPLSLDDGAKQVTLDLGGATVSYAHGAARETEITWPGPNGITSARLTFDPPPATGAAELSAAGPWALFRLFDEGSLQQAGSAERYELSFQLGEHRAAFEIRAGSVLNPFAPGMLSGFQCPQL